MIHKTIKPKREGVILLIVMAMLALFASVGLTFVFYAESEAKISSTALQGESFFRADVETELLLNHFLGQYVYDTADELSALRGKSLGRLLYGGEEAAPGTATGRNAVPFNGSGELAYPVGGPFGGQDNRKLPNFTVHAADGDARDPEWYGLRSDPARRFVGGANVPWTYADVNNFMLAAVTASGEVLLQSGHRPWTGANLADPNFHNDPSPVAKYMTLRPHRSYHPDFADPENGGGDVKNLPFGPGVRNPGGGHWVNDSFWMYTGFPVLTAANGKKYTVLFAPLIMDLDNRINLLVHGNTRGPDSTHVSQKGFGPWEVNATRVVNVADFASFVATSRPINPLPADNRYWWLTARRPGEVPTPPGYSPFNFDALPVAGGGPLVLPGLGSFSVFPSYPPGWDNGDSAELAGHPAGFSYFTSPRMHASHMDALLNSFAKGSPALTSDLFKAFKTSLTTDGNPYDPVKLRARNLVTLLSHDFNRPGLVPHLTAASTYKYGAPINPPVHFPVAGPLPTGGPHPFPDPATNPTPGGDFDGGRYGSKWGVLQRLNLNRLLTDYPPPEVSPDNSEALIADDPGFAQAQEERVQFARDIYAALIAVTGAIDPNVQMLDSDTEEYRAARWLAQLAVNIVDYIDNDDYMTPFAWHAQEVLYGTEMPRLVINEAYAQYDVDPDAVDDEEEPEKATAYRLTCWAELYNPLHETPAGYAFPREGGAARLLNGKEAVYRLLLSKPDTNLRHPDNLTGEPQKKGGADNFQLLFRPNRGVGGQPLCIVQDWPAEMNVVLPSNGQFKGTEGENEGFYLVGPDLSKGIKGKGKAEKGLWLPARKPNFPPESHKSPYMAAAIGLDELGDPPTPPTFILQRLACPHRPHHPVNNPYITVDYAENVKANDMRTHTGEGPIEKPLARGDAEAVGRRQPLAGALMIAQDPQPAPGNEPKNTFFRQNCQETILPKEGIAVPNTIDHPFDWLTHLDRPVINAMELLHVSGFRPHELTQQFISRIGDASFKFDHRAPWISETAPAWRANAENSLIYRLLEMVGTRDFMANMPIGGRVPGKININTIWDPETFKALCDASGLTGFTEKEVEEIFVAMAADRTPNPDGTIGPADRPFMPFSIGVSPGGPGMQYPQATGINSTLLRDHPADPSQRLLQAPGRLQPYQKMELLTKIYGNVTTRSNVFAVWVTAGFFEVTDDSMSPPKIGPEIGKADNREIRHKFFAIVDRTEMRMRPGDPNTGNEFPIDYPQDTTGPETVTMNGGHYVTLAGAKWNIEVGTWLTIDPDRPNEETVMVKNVSKDVEGKTVSFQFDVTLPHGPGEPIICRCWPGPWPRYDVRRDEKVVPYFTVVD